MVSTLIPSADLAPSVTSRVLVVKAIDFTEGAPATGSITFELPWDVDVKADGVILKAGRQTLEFDANGEMQIRVPTADPDTNPDAWFLVVKKSWAPHAYAIRVPVGTTPINLVDVPVVQELPAGAAPGFFLTGAAATITTGGQASVSTTVAGGIANFAFTLPAPAWARGVLSTSSLIDNLRAEVDAGVYRVPLASTATTLNLPEATPGTLTVQWIAGVSAPVAIQTFDTQGGGSWTRSNLGSGWGAWDRLDQRGRLLPNGTDINQVRTVGVHRIASSTAAATMLNVPGAVAAAGILVTYSTNGVNATTRQFFGTGSNTGVWFSSLDVALSTPENYVWTPWVSLVGSTGASPDDAGAMHALQVATARRRSGGAIGTSGRGVVALRFDHNNRNFQDKVLPLLRARGLPASHCHFVDEMNPQPGYTGDNSTGTTWADVQTAALKDGIEVWNHGWSHTDAVDIVGLTHEIVDAKTELETAMPKIKVAGFMVPGVTGTRWGGFSDNLADPLIYSKTLAGRLVMASHAACNGSLGTLWPLGDRSSMGFPSTALDTATSAASGISLVKKAADRATGTVIMVHPNIIDLGGYITTAILAEILDYIVAERDAGRLEVLTVSGLLAADPARTTRHNMVRDGAFGQGLTHWTQTTGWTVAGDVATGSTSAGLLTQNVAVADMAWVAGSARMVSALFRAPAGAVVTVQVSDAASDAAWDSVRTVTLPASESWVTVRQPVCIPAAGTTTVRARFGRVSGGAIEMREPCLTAL